MNLKKYQVTDRIWGRAVHEKSKIKYMSASFLRLTTPSQFIITVLANVADHRTLEFAWRLVIIVLLFHCSTIPLFYCSSVAT